MNCGTKNICHKRKLTLMTASYWSNNDERKQSVHILSKEDKYFKVKVTFSVILSCLRYFSDIPSVHKRNLFNTYSEF
jgi:hypothetical protein